MTADVPLTLHASCVAVGGRGLLILGPSGSGKSSLALRLIALGAVLVADDRVDLVRSGDRLIARCPPPLSGLIEARGLGILRSPFVAESPVHLVVDLATTQPARLPEHKTILLLDCRIDLVHPTLNAHFPAALLLYLREGRAG